MSELKISRFSNVTAMARQVVKYDRDPHVSASSYNWVNDNTRRMGDEKRLAKTTVATPPGGSRSFWRLLVDKNTNKSYRQTNRLSIQIV